MTDSEWLHNDPVTHSSHKQITPSKAAIINSLLRNEIKRTAVVSHEYYLRAINEGGAFSIFNVPVEAHSILLCQKTEDTRDTSATAP